LIFSQLFGVDHPCSKPPLVSIFYIPYTYTNSPYIILNCILSFLFFVLLFFLQRS
jgi:hypothetical protein